MMVIMQKSSAAWIAETLYMPVYDKDGINQVKSEFQAQKNWKNSAILDFDEFPGKRIQLEFFSVSCMIYGFKILNSLRSCILF